MTCDVELQHTISMLRSWKLLKDAICWERIIPSGSVFIEDANGIFAVNRHSNYGSYSVAFIDRHPSWFEEITPKPKRMLVIEVRDWNEDWTPRHLGLSQRGMGLGNSWDLRIDEDCFRVSIEEKHDPA